MMKIVAVVALVMVAVASARPQFFQQPAPKPIVRILQSDNTESPDGGRVVSFQTENGIVYTEKYTPIYTPEGIVFSRTITSQYLADNGQYSSRSIIADGQGSRVSGNDLPVDTTLQQ